ANLVARTHRRERRGPPARYPAGVVGHARPRRERGKTRGAAFARQRIPTHRGRATRDPGYRGIERTPRALAGARGDRGGRRLIGSKTARKAAAPRVLRLLCGSVARRASLLCVARRPMALLAICGAVATCSGEEPATPQASESAQSVAEYDVAVDLWLRRGQA